MAPKKKDRKKKETDDRDAIAQLADMGEDALRRLVDRPTQMVVGTVNGIEKRLQEIGIRLRALDPLESRVAAIEKRLDSLEGRNVATAHAPSTPPKRSTTRRTRIVVATKPKQAEHDLGPNTAAGTEGEFERSEAEASDERGSAK
jgi:hypothetical protein